VTGHIDAAVLFHVHLREQGLLLNSQR